MEEWKDRRMDRLKTVYPPKTPFCGEYNFVLAGGGGGGGGGGVIKNILN